MCGTQLASTAPFTKNMVDTASRARPRAEAGGEGIGSGLGVPGNA
jgi:hypothetical protein